jgi:F0F1-type ATP synthase membrane subunit b/b'
MRKKEMESETILIRKDYLENIKRQIEQMLRRMDLIIENMREQNKRLTDYYIQKLERENEELKNRINRDENNIG